MGETIVNYWGLLGFANCNVTEGAKFRSCGELKC